MTFEKIKALAAAEGLDAERLVLYEPFLTSWGARGYRLDYTENQRRYAYHFFDDSEEIGVEFYVAKALRELREKIDAKDER